MSFLSPNSSGVDGSPSSTLTAFTPRANPQEFFLREPLPSTEPAQHEASAAPSQSSSPRATAGPSHSSQDRAAANERSQQDRRSQEPPAQGKPPMPDVLALLPDS